MYGRKTVGLPTTYTVHRYGGGLTSGLEPEAAQTALELALPRSHYRPSTGKVADRT